VDVKSFLMFKAVKFLSAYDLQLMFYCKIGSETQFSFQDGKLDYFFHSYNNYRITERTIEIPIIGYYLKKLTPKNVLEIGNVSNHYYDFFRKIRPDNTDVVDKYEKGFNVINQDIADYHPDKKYDFVFSISTFEHMDEDRRVQSAITEKREECNTCVAIENMKYVVNQLLQQGSTFIITIPLGQSPEFDISFLRGDLKEITCKSYQTYLMVRTSELKWIQSFEQIKEIPHYPESIKNSKFVGVNHLLVIKINT
jgi:hypothetical protein